MVAGHTLYYLWLAQCRHSAGTRLLVNAESARCIAGVGMKTVIRLMIAMILAPFALIALGWIIMVFEGGP